MANIRFLLHFFAVSASTIGAATPVLPVLAADRHDAPFPLCSGPGRVTCVVDGDTIWFHGEKIRIADINAPEVSHPGCDAELTLGRAATARLQVLLGAGPFTLTPAADGRDRDRYGRLLRVITRDGHSLGDDMVRAGLAEEWQGHRRNWC
ncbi:MAG: hypothetical protein RLZZ08_156 [Pseudomonadota bacterium]|jgi:endonuclease YncB( thermonuclease family)